MASGDDRNVMLWRGAEIGEIIDELSRGYAEIFTAPPWNEVHHTGFADTASTFRRRLEHDATRPGFRVATAGTAGDIGGFASGWTTRAPFRTDRAYPKVMAKYGAATVESSLIGAFEIDELAVREASRGKGLARRLLAELLADTADGRAWLLTWTGAEDTVKFYQRAGWHPAKPLPLVDNDILVFLSPEHPDAGSTA